MHLLVEAPGRVNIIGEHTDYNQGYVLPAAIDLKISLTVSKRRDKTVKAYARNLEEEALFELTDLVPGNNNQNWWDYLAGVCWALQEAGYSIPGADLDFGGNIPIGAGLSSSAALEIAAAAAFAYLGDIEIGKKELALLCQKAENEYVGVQCGIMDQFAVALSRPDHALFIDCRSLEYQHILLNMADYRLIIIDSRVERKLAGSDYNRRRAECAEALKLLNSNSVQKHCSLRDLVPEDIRNAQSFLPVNLYKRALFITEENHRVLETVASFKQGDLQKVGQLMLDSHDGLRDLYEVSCPELDLIVELADSMKGVLGARMTGAGFGGCAVILADQNCLADLRQLVLVESSGKLPREPYFYAVKPSGGYAVTLLDNSR